MGSPEEDRKRRANNSSDEDEDDKDRSKKRRKDDDSSSDDDSRRKRKRKHKHKKSKRRRRDDDSDSSSESDDSSSSTSTDEESRKHRKRHKKKKHSKEKKRHRKHKKDKKKDKKKSSNSKKQDKDDDVKDDGLPVFGKYGILKGSDFYKKQRSFEVWMAEVKGMAEYKGPKWETQKYFDEYREDYNTATFPHKKYYDFEKWEMEEYQKQQAKQRELADSGKSSHRADEARHQLEQRKLAQHKQKADHHLQLSMMSKEKIQEMKRQQQLKTELEVAFKTGDQEKVKKLKAKLEPDDK